VFYGLLASPKKSQHLRRTEPNLQNYQIHQTAEHCYPPPTWECFRTLTNIYPPLSMLRAVVDGKVVVLIVTRIAVGQWRVAPTASVSNRIGNHSINRRRLVVASNYKWPYGVNVAHCRLKSAMLGIAKLTHCGLVLSDFLQKPTSALLLLSTMAFVRWS